MKIAIDKHKRRLIEEMNMRASQTKTNLDHAQQQHELASVSLSSVINSIVLAADIEEGTEIESTTLGRDADGDFMIVVTKPKRIEG